MSSETGALQAFIDSTTLRLAALEALVKPLPVPLPVPTPDPQIQWRTGVEVGDLSAWSPQENTGFAASSAVQVAAEGIPGRTSKLFGNASLWVMKQAISAPSGTVEASGTRISRYPEIDKLCRAGTPFYYSWWDFFPQGLSYASGFYNHWQIMSHDGSPSGYHPIWVLGVNGSGMTTSLFWSPNNMAPAEGPHAGEAGSRTYSSAISIPVGQWVFFEAMVKPASDFTGALKMWLNGQVLYDLAGIKTQFPLTTQPILSWVANNCYGVGFPTPFAHYVDDVTVSLGRLP